MADIRGRDVKVPVGGQRIEGGFTAQACAIELQCLRYGRRRRNGDRDRLEASPGPDEELIPELVAELLEVEDKRWLGNDGSPQMGREMCRETVCTTVYISVVAESFKK